ncbi:copper homeostasis protein CutC [Lentibacillus kapialis]|uniref:PF03932 family protein CutC n=1 Tax=Lentibacillus kapialis TaxID=340214 RepID=A0A917PVZ3_9BACI|nr:copper homeostasis protein CutC [Lentibacillus kapialis]GGJ95678.1 copper homeostasis protein CutC [Lentibacillus kapialis]
MLLEFIVQNGEEAKQAEEMGADRVELVSAISEGGLTPSYGTMQQVFESVSIPVQVMIRPHSFHYCYSDDDLDIVRKDIQSLIDLGGKRIVFGVLHHDGTVHETALQALIERYPQLDMTFHKAFDEIPSQQDAYQTLSKYKHNVKRILTSGGKKDCLSGKEPLHELVKMERETNGPAIMPGGGLHVGNIADVHQTVNAEQYHFGKAVRLHDSFSYPFDDEKINRIKDVIQKGKH